MNIPQEPPPNELLLLPKLEHSAELEPDEFSDAATPSNSAIHSQFAHHSGLFEPKIELLSAADSCDPLDPLAPSAADPVTGDPSTPPPPQFSCPQCGKSFKEQRRLDYHIQTHSDERPFGCTVCAKRFKQRFHLVDHMRTHTGEAPFPCSYCPKVYKQFASRRIHEMSHTGERPFGCEFCSKAFKTNKMREEHMQTHRLGKPFQCEHCDKAFKSTAHRAIHMRTHTGETPFSCAHCPRTFVLAANRGMHERSHAGAKAAKTVKTKPVVPRIAAVHSQYDQPVECPAAESDEHRDDITPMHELLTPKLELHEFSRPSESSDISDSQADEYDQHNEPILKIELPEHSDPNGFN